MSFRRYFKRGLQVLAVIVIAWHIYVLGLLGSRFEPDDATDRAVVFAALEHFAQQDWSDRGFDENAGTIYLSPQTFGQFDEYYFPPWHAWPLFWQLGQAAIDRNAVSQAHGWTGTGNVKIRKWPESYVSRADEPEDFRCRAMVNKPGYSRSGRVAVLSIYFGPTPHGAIAIYVLKRNENGWSVVTFETWFYA